MRKLLQASSLILLVVLLATPAWPQSSYTAAVRGTVTDQSGGSIPDAKVVLTEADRNVPHPTTTDAVGRYSLTALPPGGYTLTVEAKGFKKYTLTNIPLAVQQQATLDVSLQVGDIATTVEVRSTTRC